jgi:hypothetical protein
MKDPDYTNSSKTTSREVPRQLLYRVDSRIVSQPSLEVYTDACVLVNISASETYV